MRRNASKRYLAPDVRVIASRDGVLLLSDKGAFRVTTLSSASFISEVLPQLAAERDRLSVRTRSVRLRDLFHHLSGLALTTETETVRAMPSPHRRFGGVRLWRRTPFCKEVLHQLRLLGIKTSVSSTDDDLWVADCSGLAPDEATAVAQEVHRNGARSLTFWTNGPEVFYGPFAEHPHTSCWNCFRRRFADLLSSEPTPRANPADSAVHARVLAENLVLALRYPHLVAHGCMLVESPGSSTVHSIVPVPWCEVCHFGEESRHTHVVPAAHSVHIPQEFHILADTRGGVLRRILLSDANEDDAPVVPAWCSAVSAAPPNPWTIALPPYTGEGKGATRSEAVRSAVGEAIERYGASVWNPRHSMRASLDELGDQAFDPRALVLYDDEQYTRPGFPYARFDPHSPIDWVRGQWLDTGDEAYLPALATYMYFPAPIPEQFIQVTTNGLAAGSSFEDAALRALYELIERDALMLSWLAKLPGDRVSPDGIEPEVEHALRESQRFGARTELYILDLGIGIPTAVCLGFGDGVSWPGLTIGSASHANVDVALRKAVFEHGHFGPYMRRLMIAGDHRPVTSPEHVRTTLDHGLYFIHPEHASSMDFLRRRTGDPLPLCMFRERFDAPPTLDACVSALGHAGIRSAAVDVTPPDVALAPVRVVRAFGEFLQPIHFGTGYERLQNPRLHALLWDGINTTPHPIA